MKHVSKLFASVLCRILVAPFAYPILWLKVIDGRHLIFQFGSQWMSLVPGMPGVYLRREYYKVVLGLKSAGFVIEFGTLLCQRGIEIGNNVYVGPFCNIGLSAIEDDVLLGGNVDIVSGSHVHHFDRTDIPIRLQGGELRKIRIGRDTWIGNKAVVLEDVAEGTVVGAGSVVTKKFESGYVLAGSPARMIRRRGSSPNTDAT